MKTFTIECVTLETVCEFNKLDIEAVFERLNDSEISFGNNGDTLLTRTQLQCILGHELDWDLQDIFISLGC
jgi:hypothetical protein